MQTFLQYLLNNEFDPAFYKRSKFIFQKIEQIHPEKILDVGCGRGFYIKALANLSYIKEIIGVDLNEKYLEKARTYCRDSRVVFQKANALNLPFTDNHFDLIICSEVLEHLSNDRKALCEIKRVLKPNGILLITVPNYNFPFLWDPLNWFLMKLFKKHIDKNIWWLAGIWADHERLYKENEIKQLTQTTGFKIDVFDQAVKICWPFSHFMLYGIGKNLIERLNLKMGNRFDFKSKSLSPLSIFFRLPLKLEKLIKTKSSVNFLIQASK